METLNLVKILKGCPEGTKLYSPMFGEVILKRVVQDGTCYAIETNSAFTKAIASFTADGRYYDGEQDSECMLFPSKECRDWSQFKQPQKLQNGDHILWRNNDNNEFLGVFVGYTENEQGVINMFQGDHCCGVDVYIKDLTKVEKFDPKCLETGDAVLVRDGKDDEWSYTNFSHITKSPERQFCASCTYWRMCVPYNQETKHLIGTCYKAPKFYDLNEK